MTPDPTDPSDVSAVREFAERLRASLAAGDLVRAVLSKYRGPEPELQRVNLKCVLLRGQPQLQLVYRYARRDITRNAAPDDGVAQVRGLLGVRGFRAAHLHTAAGSYELKITERGGTHLRHVAPPASARGGTEAAGARAAPVELAHDRPKHRMLAIDRPFLAALGVTTDQHRLVPAMARKWKQINKFLEIVAGALDAAPTPAQVPLRVVDFGSGKGYLTFALHDWLRQTRHVEAQVTGVELRADMVALCRSVVDALGLQGLAFEQGDVRRWSPGAIDVVIALHACDTATDHAIGLGIRAGAGLIVCAPCCHKQLRPQLLSPHPLRPILQHGVHLGQQAEMLTDGLRALLLEAAGYDTQVFEFVSLEHTQKNKMILAVRRAAPKPREPILDQIAELKAFYGIREHCLETLLRDRFSAGRGAATAAAGP